MDSKKVVITAELTKELSDIPVESSLVTKLLERKILAQESAPRITKLIEDGKPAEAKRELLSYIEKYYTFSYLETFCECLEELSKDAKPTLLRHVQVIRDELQKQKSANENNDESDSKRRRISDTDQDVIPDSGFTASFDSTPLSSHSRKQSMKQISLATTEIVWSWYSQPLPHTCCSAAANDDTLLVMTKGEDKKKKSDVIFTISSTHDDDWKPVPMPNVQLSSFSITVLGEYLYLTGGKVEKTVPGTKATESREVWMWSLDECSLHNRKWTKKLPDMQEARFCHGSGSFSDYLVVVGGLKVSSMEIIKASAADPAWFKICTLPINLVWPYIAASKDYLYFGFGYTDGISQSSNYLAAISLGNLDKAAQDRMRVKLSQLEEIPLPPNELSALAVLDDKPVAIGGAVLDQETGVPIRSVSDCFVLNDGAKWQHLPRMKSSRCSPCVATISDGIVVVGGTTIAPKVSYPEKSQSSPCSAVEKAEIAA
jgi:hypothetical protein